MATVRDRGACPCPRCLITKEKLDKLGQKLDMTSRITQARTYLSEVITTTRNAIYNRGFVITSSRVSHVMKSLSLVPTLVSGQQTNMMFRNSPYYCTQNAFAEKLGPFGFNPYPMFVVDLLHEFELGVWKATFTHIIRVMYAAVPGGEGVAKIDARSVQCF